MSTTAADVIPLITNPLGKYWEQPPLEVILMDEECAIIEERYLKKLAKYSCSIPSGVYPGKMWRHDNADFNKPETYVHRHWLRWYGTYTDEIKTRVSLNSIPLYIV